MSNERILNTLRAPHISEKAARYAKPLPVDPDTGKIGRAHV